MKKMFLLAFLSGLCATMVGAAEVSSAPSTSTYTVTKGDTLWNIAQQQYQDPFKWPAIWNANKDAISNPDLIYPDQVMVIPPAPTSGVPAPARPEKEEAKAAVPQVAEDQAEEQEPATAEEMAQKSPERADPEAVPGALEAPEKEAVPAARREKTAEPVPAQAPESSFYQTGGIIAPRDWKADGFIVGDKEKKLLISSGDTVYVDIGREQLKPGTQCMVYRKMRKMKSPATGEFLGYELHRVGKIEITDGGEEKTSSAKVIVSYDPIEVGDMVKIIENKN